MTPKDSRSVELTASSRPYESTSPTAAARVTSVGKYTLAAAGCLAVLGVLIPVILLKNIKSQLHRDYTMIKASQHLWDAVPGNRAITHLKSMYFYSITDEDLYYKFRGANLSITKVLLYHKYMKLENPVISDTYVEGKLNETYFLDERHNRVKVYGESVRQIRPGFLKAVNLIESKTMA